MHNKPTARSRASSGLRVVDGGNMSPAVLNADRLRAAQLAVMRGYEEAVELLGPGLDLGAHVRLSWFQEGLADARTIAGLPRLRALDRGGHA
jgi:hypothetical protein